MITTLPCPRLLGIAWEFETDDGVIITNFSTKYRIVEILVKVMTEVFESQEL